jgi:NAD(P)-dependent dehydrogenase (short-subunit alcohol dehydrogenase family)
MDFNGKVVVITGGGTGIGKSAAILFAARGAKVVIAGRRGEQLSQVVKEINENGGEAIYIKADVGKSKDVEELINYTVKNYNQLDIMVNNAGINLTKALIDTTDEEVDRLFDTNVKGTFYGMRAAIRQMKKQKTGGSIINVSSMSGLMGHPFRTPYCGTKAAVINMTRCAAIEYAKDGIRVNVICPGVIETPMVQEVRDVAPDVLDSYVQTMPMQRVADADECSKAILYLASEEYASYVTGVYLSVDGGFAAGR